MTKTLSIAIVLALAACGGAEKQTVEPAPSAAVFGLGDASLTAEKDGEKQEIKLTADGKLWANGEHVMTVNAAGEIMDVDGTVKARMSADGTLTSIPPKPDVDDDLTIREDGAVLDDKGAVVIEFGADGYLTGPLFETEGAGAKVLFTGPPETRRALALALFLVGGDEAKEPAEASGATTEPAPVPAPAPAPAPGN